MKGALALQLEATISTWCDRDLDLAGVVLEATGGQAFRFAETAHHAAPKANLASPFVGPGCLSSAKV